MIAPIIPLLRSLRFFTFAATTITSFPRCLAAVHDASRVWKVWDESLAGTKSLENLEPLWLQISLFFEGLK